jgi:hypothetical protein
VITRIESYFILVIRSCDNSSFITKSNIIKVQDILGISGDYIMLYKVWREVLFHIYVLYLLIIFLTIPCILGK